MDIWYGLTIKHQSRNLFVFLRLGTHGDLILQYNTIQYNKIQYNTIQYNTIQNNTIQYNTIQYNTIQYNKCQTTSKISPFSLENWTSILLEIFSETSGLGLNSFSRFAQFKIDLERKRVNHFFKFFYFDTSFSFKNSGFLFPWFHVTKRTYNILF